MLLKEGDFQFGYRLWIEDKDSVEVPLDQPLSQSNLPLSMNYYKDLLKRVPRGVRCCELYSLYLGMVSVNVVASYERKLITIAKSMLLSRS